MDLRDNSEGEKKERATKTWSSNVNKGPFQNFLDCTCIKAKFEIEGIERGNLFIVGVKKINLFAETPIPQSFLLDRYM